MTSKGAGLLAIVVAAAVLWAIPTVSLGKSVDLRKAGEALRQVTEGVGAAVNKAVAKTDEELRKAREKAAKEKAAAAAKARQATQRATQRATATDPPTQPPMHGTDPHAQGAVAVVDVDPSNERPLANDPSGKTTGEDAIVGRTRGDKVGGAYHGHISIISLLGSELASVDTAPGEAKHGPLEPIQTGILDPLCKSTNNQVCLSVLTANSTTTATSSTNDFAIARASVLGLGVGAAESTSTISEDAKCQSADGVAKTVNVTSPGGGAVAQVANSTSHSKSCRGAAPEVKNTSQVIGLGGVQVPLPAAGCADGTPDTVSGIPGLLPIVCNAEDIVGAAAVREALDVFVLQVGGTSLAKETTAAAESLTVAPAEQGKQCSDKKDNDGDHLIDADDPGCHTDGNANNSNSYNPNDDDESNAGPGKQCSDGKDNDGDHLIDADDPGCHSDNNPNNPDSYNPNDNDESNTTSSTECKDKKDNDGDGKIDANDPGCHVDNDINNPYNPNDDSEDSDNGNKTHNGNGNAPTGGQNANAGTLPFTGSDVIGLGIAGLLMLAGGMLLRRREDTHAAL
jgi:LPXTG-motif cell wall-anchored protein